MYELIDRIDRASEIELRHPDGSGYLVRCCHTGKIESRVVCASGDISDAVERSPEAFLHHHPDAAEVPGIGAALFRLASNGATEEHAGTIRTDRRARRIAPGHLKPVLRRGPR